MVISECLQNGLGWIVVKVTKAKLSPTKEWWEPQRFNKRRWGVSLGKYIIIVRPSLTTLKHERGHRVQSRKLGPLYLFTVGIVSITRNIWDRLFHKKWCMYDRLSWYYGAWPENEADKLGGVKR